MLESYSEAEDKGPDAFENEAKRMELEREMEHGLDASLRKQVSHKR